MVKLVASKPTGDGQNLLQDNQQEAGLSRKEFRTKNAPLDQVGQQSTPVLLTRRQLAERWACCGHTIARRQDLKPIRFNKRFLRYRLVDIEAVEAAAAV